jgi:hypothetical protein
MRLASQIWADEFDSYDTIDEDVPRSVDDTHAAFPDSCLKPIAAGDDLAECGVMTGTAA